MRRLEGDGRLRHQSPVGSDSHFCVTYQPENPLTLNRRVRRVWVVRVGFRMKSRLVLILFRLMALVGAWWLELLGIAYTPLARSSRFWLASFCQTPPAGSPHASRDTLKPPPRPGPVRSLLLPEHVDSKRSIAKGVWLTWRPSEGSVRSGHSRPSNAPVTQHHGRPGCFHQLTSRT
jgi:hypothetical protein